MPSFNELDEEQLKIYQGAPPTGSVLVVGPPGTGKTVMAFHRAQMLKELRHAPRIIMYNSVLRSFTSGGHDAGKGVEVSTMHSWVSSWFSAMRAGRAPQREPWIFDWTAILEKVLTVVRGPEPHLSHWGHLIVDEGQDFSREMYQALAMLTRAREWPAQGPALTVFADENQRLNEVQNSTINDLRDAMRLADAGRVFSLTRNYRNTRQIAEFASHFYCGLQSGIPDMPERKGPVPVVHFVSGPSAMAKVVAQFVRDQAPMEIGVLCSRDKDRKRMHKMIGEELEDEDGVTVQTFKSQHPEYGDAEDLVFDEPGYVTVLNYQSAKGLEFDAVFVVDPFVGRAGAGAGQQQFKMNMYVMCSRARTHLRLLFETERAEVLRHLPPSQLYKEAK